MRTFIFFILFLKLNYSSAQTISTDKNNSASLFEKAIHPDKKRIHAIDYSVIGLYPASMSWLYTQWYKNYPKSSFHFFDDNKEWLQMDKFGHCWDAYNISKPLTHLYEWAGEEHTKATLYGAGIAFLFQTTVEVFDGFSSQWGFSYGDMLCNTAGVLIFTSQELKWNEQRVVLKYSFHQSKYSQYRPDELGKTLPENILKDYNGLTYWASVNPASFFKDSKFPKWLSIAAGFGADGMIGGIENPETVDGKPVPYFERFRQYYLSIDFDLARVKFKSKFLNSFFKVINIVHLPAPAVEFNNGRQTKFHLLYF